VQAPGRQGRLLLALPLGSLAAPTLASGMRHISHRPPLPRCRQCRAKVREPGRDICLMCSLGRNDRRGQQQQQTGAISGKAR
jgi:hypothetical protein